MLTTRSPLGQFIRSPLGVRSSTSGYLTVEFWPTIGDALQIIGNVNYIKAPVLALITDRRRPYSYYIGKTLKLTATIAGQPIRLSLQGTATFEYEIYTNAVNGLFSLPSWVGYAGNIWFETDWQDEGKTLELKCEVLNLEASVSDIIHYVTKPITSNVATVGYSRDDVVDATESYAQYYNNTLNLPLIVNHYSDFWNAHMEICHYVPPDPTLMYFRSELFCFCLIYDLNDWPGYKELYLDCRVWSVSLELYTEPLDQLLLAFDVSDFIDGVDDANLKKCYLNINSGEQVGEILLSDLAAKTHDSGDSWVLGPFRTGRRYLACAFITRGFLDRTPLITQQPWPTDTGVANLIDYFRAYSRITR